MLIHLIRHTTPNVAPGICYGQADLSLADTFDQEKAIVHRRLLPFYDAVYSSPLQRCALLADSIDAPQRFVDDRLMEYNFGDWELMPWDELKTPETQYWMDNFVDQATPNGESIMTMKKRVDEFFSELYESNFKTIAIVSHSGVQRLIQAQTLKIPLTQLFGLQLDYGAVLELKLNNEKTSIAIKHL